METTKKAFDLSRDSVYVAFPETQLRIIGGREHLRGAELGELDDRRTSHVLYDRESLMAPITDDEVANVDAFGVLQPIIVAKDPDDGIVNVVVGRGRVRKARVANARRAEKGAPLIKIRCVVRRANDLDLFGVLISENEHRRVTSVTEKIEKAKFYLSIGADNERIANAFRVKVKTVEGWLAFDDNATRETKAAVARGDLKATAAAVVAAIKDPEKQRARLAEILDRAAVTKKPATVKAATNATRSGNAPIATREAKKILAAVKATDFKASREWWSGVEEALELVTGGDVNERFAQILSDAGVK